jgi:hypothetical protein
MVKILKKGLEFGKLRFLGRIGIILLYRIE